ncbi:MAG TPA: hypothetical protein VL989_02630 [Candidatus Sulfotelmatobacter sp.]|nr:hypothetical protein [Candidatus Sulfotelmatobacter sp.]
MLPRRFQPERTSNFSSAKSRIENRRLKRDGSGNPYVMRDAQGILRYVFDTSELDPTSTVDARVIHKEITIKELGGKTIHILSGDNGVTESHREDEVANALKRDIPLEKLGHLGVVVFETSTEVV